jgi:hypothetical protein
MHLAFRSDTSEWPTLADKIAVRTRVERLGLAHILPKLYATADDAAMIDWDALPDQFVAKANNGCTSVRIVRDKSTLNRAELIATMNGWLATPYGYVSAEPHYSKITPRLLIEQYLPNESSPESMLIDYKFWVIHGKVAGCLVCTNRDTQHHRVELNWYDLPGWTRRPDVISPKFRNNTEVPRPEHLTEMMAHAATLAEGLPVVRVDLYDTAGQVWFGELTLTSNGGRMAYFTPQHLRHLFQL